MTVRQAYKMAAISCLPFLMADKPQKKLDHDNLVALAASVADAMLREDEANDRELDD